MEEITLLDEQERLEIERYVRSAIWEGDVELLQNYLKKYIFGSELLSVAVTANLKCRSAMVQFLIDYTEDINFQDLEGNTALQRALKQGIVEVKIRWRYPERGVDSVVEEIVQILLQHGTKVNTPDILGCTPIFYSVHFHQTNITKMLLDAGATVNHQSKNSESPLHYALKYGTLEVVNMLLKNGADVNVGSEEGSPIILKAIEGTTDDEEKLKCLLKYGADINAQDENGWTALMKAIDYKKRSLLKEIVELGADISLKTLNGDTACTLVKAKFCLNNDMCETFGQIVCNECHHCLIPLMIKVVFPFDYHADGDVSHIYTRPKHIQHLSPLCIALIHSHSNIVRYFMENMFLIRSDVRSLPQNIKFREELDQQAQPEVVEVFDEYFSQPLTLFTLSFVEVSSMLGTGSERETRVRAAGIPRSLQDRLLFKKLAAKLILTARSRRGY